MVNYQLGKIYIITSETNKLLYVGSTAQLYISTRLQGHIKDFKQGRISCCSFKLMDCEDYNIKLLKEFPCCNKKQLEREEGFWILHYKEQTDYTCVNKNIAGRTNKEWREANKEYISEYREANKAHTSLRGKEYYQANKEQISEKSKEHYQANKERFTEKHNCPCGGKYTTKNKPIHDKTTLHQDYLKSQNK
jgi:hypothetical protein